MAEPGRRRRLTGVGIAAGLVVAVLLGAATYGLLRGPSGTPGTGPATTATPLPTAPTVTRPDELPDTTDPQVFARRVAEALFTWDTTSGHHPADYAQVLLRAGDPTGTETAGLAADVRSYLPTAETWAQLRQYQTRQWLTIDELAVPEAWADAQAQAAPGTTAYTVTGTRHRAGIWDGEPVDATRDVAFTIFLTCRPSFDHCRLLRLSQLDNPLR